MGQRANAVRIHPGARGIGTSMDHRVPHLGYDLTQLIAPEMGSTIKYSGDSAHFRSA
jgi:hypothetical protein